MAAHAILSLLELTLITFLHKFIKFPSLYKNMLLILSENVNLIAYMHVFIVITFIPRFIYKYFMINFLSHKKRASFQSRKLE